MATARPRQCTCGKPEGVVLHEPKCAVNQMSGQFRFFAPRMNAAKKAKAENAAARRQVVIDMANQLIVQHARPITRGRLAEMIHDSWDDPGLGVTAIRRILKEENLPSKI